MSRSTNKEVIISVQRPGAVDNIDLGPLISELTVEPWMLVRDFSDEHHPDGEIQISIQRTHEWEYLIYIAITGGTTFAGAATAALGTRFGNWIADQVGDASRENQEIEIRTETGSSTTIPIEEIEKSSDEITVMLESGSEDEEKVIIEM